MGIKLEKKILFFWFFQISTAKTQLESVERHLRRFRKDYSHIHEWYVKADHEIRKIENKQVSKNTKEEVDWIRVSSFSFLINFIS